VLKKLEVIVVVENVVAILEEKREDLISGYIQQLLSDPQLEALRKLSDPEFQGLAGYILTSLNNFIDGDEPEVSGCQDFIGNTCFQLSIPLLEAAYALYLLRDQVANVLTANGVAGELLNRTNQFFDSLVLELLRRY
jgi:hypothetical protein